MLAAFPNAMPMEGLIGGVLIGLAAAIMLLGAGKIAGVSGIAARAAGLTRSGFDIPGIFFLLGLPAGALIASHLFGPIAQTFPDSAAVLALAGLIVGYGTRIGSGCTSGHGVCGMSRLSRRSIVATLTFIGSGILTVAIINFMGWN